jgi:hypothetical protein
LIKCLYTLYVSELYGFDIEACYPEELVELRRTLGACIFPFLSLETNQPQLMRFNIGDYFYLCYSNQAKNRRILSLMTDEVEDFDYFEEDFEKLISKIFSINDLQQSQLILKESFEAFKEIQKDAKEKLKEN